MLGLVEFNFKIKSTIIIVNFNKTITYNQNLFFISKVFTLQIY